MKRVRLLAPGHIELQDDCPGVERKPETVKIDVSACGICGSDLALLTGRRSLENERYFGHEFSGIVVDAGEGYNGIQNGMRVASELVNTCGQCWNCRNGLENYCRSMNDALLPGGFSTETLVLNTPTYCFLSQVPRGMDDITATLLEPTNCAWHIAMRAKMKPGDTVVVFGMGTIGLISSQILKKLGAGKIVGIDTNKVRLEQVKKTGLIDTIDRSDKNWLEQVREICGEKGADLVVEATGVPVVLQDAFQAVRPGGTIVVGSVYHGSISQFEPLPIMRKELTIVGSKGPAPSVKTDGKSVVVDILEALQEDLKKIITVYEYKDGVKAFEDIASGAVIKPVITFK